MNARSIRRAAEERLARKCARRCDLPHPAATPSLADINRVQINKENAQHSTGPITAEGKSKSTLNAVKPALTGRTVLLPSDDADAYRNHFTS